MLSNCHPTSPAGEAPGSGGRQGQGEVLQAPAPECPPLPVTESSTLSMKQDAHLGGGPVSSPLFLPQQDLEKALGWEVPAPSGPMRPGLWHYTEFLGSLGQPQGLQTGVLQEPGSQGPVQFLSSCSPWGVNFPRLCVLTGKVGTPGGVCTLSWTMALLGLHCWIWQP